MALTVEEAAQISNIGENKLRDLIHAGRLEYFKIGNRYLIPTEGLREFIRAAGKSKTQI